MSIVERERIGDVVIIRMNRPEKLNAMNKEMMIGLALAFAEYQDTPSERVAVLTGSGRGFCAGEDLVESAHNQSWGLAADVPYDPFWKRTLDKPVIAAVNGWAMGGGFIQASYADLRIASRNAVFEISEARHQLIGSYRFGFCDTLPWAVATELALGFPITAERAYQVGFVNRLVDTADDLVPAALEMCEHMLSLPPGCVQNTIEIARRLRPGIPDDVQARSDDLAKTGGNPEDIFEARRAFAERRKPNFKGVTPAP